MNSLRQVCAFFVLIPLAAYLVLLDVHLGKMVFAPPDYPVIDFFKSDGAHVQDEDLSASPTTRGLLTLYCVGTNLALAGVFRALVRVYRGALEAKGRRTSRSRHS